MDDLGSFQNSNQLSLDEPVGSILSLGNEDHRFETADYSIEDRFRLLKAATLRVGLSLRQQGIRNINRTRAPTDPMVDGNNGGEIHGAGNGGTSESNEQRICCKRGSTLLVAMALEVDTEVKRVCYDGGNFYDCNICLRIAKEPVLTCCGHLFCWVCFYRLPYVDSCARECPVCEGEVSDSNITPIYGNGDSTRDLVVESSLVIPPRPKAQRVESVRQQRVPRGTIHIPVSEALRRIRTSISGLENNRLEDSINDGVTLDPNYFIARRDVNRRFRSRLLSRVLSGTASSLAEISSALDNVERLSEDLEMHVNDHLLRRSSQALNDEAMSLFEQVPIAATLNASGLDDGIPVTGNPSTNSSVELNSSPP